MPSYNPYSYQYPQYGYQMPQQSQQPAPMPPQMQSGGFMSVRSEQEARSYPVAPGNVMTFKIENQPYVCEKAQGFSQLEGPVFNKYRLVKEEEPSTAPNSLDNATSDSKVTNTTINDIISEIEAIKDDIKGIKEQLKSAQKPGSKKTVRTEDEDDE